MLDSSPNLVAPSAHSPTFGFAFVVLLPTGFTPWIVIKQKLDFGQNSTRMSSQVGQFGTSRLENEQFWIRVSMFGLHLAIVFILIFESSKKGQISQKNHLKANMNG